MRTSSCKNATCRPHPGVCTQGKYYRHLFPKLFCTGDQFLQIRVITFAEEFWKSRCDWIFSSARLFAGRSMSTTMTSLTRRMEMPTKARMGPRELLGSTCPLPKETSARTIQKVPFQSCLSLKTRAMPSSVTGGSADSTIRYSEKNDGCRSLRNIEFPPKASSENVPGYSRNLIP